MNNPYLDKLFDILKYNKLEKLILENPEQKEVEKEYMLKVIRIYRKHGVPYETWQKISADIGQLNQEFESKL